MSKRVFAAAALLLAACPINPALAAWGCAYDSSAGVGRTWNAPSEKEARETVMHNCTVRNFKGCRVIGCAENVETKEQADKLWARTPGIKYEQCGGPGQPKCK